MRGIGPTLLVVSPAILWFRGGSKHALSDPSRKRDYVIVR
jgi:hypothetical protein